MVNGGPQPAKAPLRFTVARPPARRHTELPLSTDTDGLGLIADQKGNPVWPIACEDDRRSCGAIATLFGSELKEIDTTSPIQAQPKSGWVAGIGDVGREAELYAHLTGRHHVTINSVAALDLPSVPEVFLSVGASLDKELVRFVLSCQDAAVYPGIIWAPLAAGLRQQVLVAAAAATLNGAVACPRLDISGLDEGGESGIASLSRASSRREIRAGLSRGAGVLTISAHGDGYSIGTGPDSSLCGVVSQQLPGVRELPPACYLTEECQRHHEPISKAKSDGLLISAEEVSARVAVLAACRSAFIGSWTVDSQWGLLARLVRSPQIGAVIATPEIMFLNRASLSAELAAALASGVPAGLAISNFYKGNPAKSCGMRWLLFGDPRTTAGPGSGKVSLMPRIAEREPPLPQSSNTPSYLDTELLRLIAFEKPPQDAAHSVERKKGHRTSRELLARLEDWEEGRRQKSTTLSSSLQLAAFRHLAAIRAGVHHLSRHSVGTQTALIDCPECGWPVQRHTHTFRSSVKRQSFICPVCEFSEDVPAEDGQQRALVRCGFPVPWLVLSNLPVEDEVRAACITFAPEDKEARLRLLPSPGGSEYRASIDLCDTSPMRVDTPQIVRVVVLHHAAIYAFGTCIKPSTLERYQDFSELHEAQHERSYNER